MHSSVHEAGDVLSGLLPQIIGEILVGIYLTGSAVTDDWDPDVSDIDLFVVTTTPIVGHVMDELRQAHQYVAEHYRWGSRLEVQYAFQGQLLPSGIVGNAPSWDSTSGFQVGPSVAAADDILGVREFGVAIAGPRPSLVFPPVSLVQLERAMLEYLNDLLTRDTRRPKASDQEYASWILNIARCLYSLSAGKLCTKRTAAYWLLQEDPRTGPILKTALRAWKGDTAARIDCRHSFAWFAAEVRRLLTDRRWV